MRMDEKRNFCAKRGQLRKSRNANGHVITNAAGLNNGLIGMLGDELAAQVCNHCFFPFSDSPAARKTDNNWAASRFFNKPSSSSTLMEPLSNAISAASKAL